MARRVYTITTRLIVTLLGYYLMGSKIQTACVGIASTMAKHSSFGRNFECAAFANLQKKMQKLQCTAT